MATIVLQVAGAAIGAAIGGPVGATIGRAAGAYAGYLIDRELFGTQNVIRGGRLDDIRYLTAQEGVPIPRVYGRVRTGGQIIWATRFKETKRSKSSGGGKGGGSKTRTETFSYSASFAIGICEGPISHIGRIWADGTELDRTRYTIRMFKGDEDQDPDALIEAKQGFGNAPGYRGTAYAVFEDFPLADYGNRIPQITFEVIRSVASVDRDIRAINLIPGATEYGYSPSPVANAKGAIPAFMNRNTLTADCDLTASLDELQAVCPNLNTVSLVTAWYGDDLRAAHCRIKPKIIGPNADLPAWQCAGVTRQTAATVSMIDGRASYGGTPSDASIVAAIRELKARDLKPAFYPFIMMDIPSYNGLADPYGANSQPAHPWRGRITCDPATGQNGSVNETQVARDQIEAFVGTARVSDFSIANDAVVYSGPDEWTLRRMVLHYAHLCAAAGGVDTFLIASELPGLTRVRDEAQRFPFVEALISLADDVRSVLGPSVKISYAADWSEYFGYHPGNATNDIHFNLDPLWASPNIDFIGIDNYMPLSDWRDGGDPGFPDQNSIHDPHYLEANIAAGEGHDWFYQDDAARVSGTRTPITDSEGEPWVWAYKRLAQWWSNPHHDRIGGVRSAQPTAWQPQMKPIRFTELGCPAVNRGTNQPNVFLDPKSDQSRLPHFSRGAQDDLLILRYAEAQLGFWHEDYLDADVHNPVSSVYAGRMIDPADLAFWAWDARPYPSFPQALSTWSDGENWYRGHWLNGRLGTCPVDALIETVFDDLDLPKPEIAVDGHVTGFAIAAEASLRDILEPVLAGFAISVNEQDGRLRFTGKARQKPVAIGPDAYVRTEDRPLTTIERMADFEISDGLALKVADPHGDFQQATIVEALRGANPLRQAMIELPAAMPRGAARQLAKARLRDLWIARTQRSASLSHVYRHLQAGDLIRLEDGELLLLSSVVHSRAVEMEARAFRHFEEAGGFDGLPRVVAGAIAIAGQADALLMNLPVVVDDMGSPHALFAAVSAPVWQRSHAILQSPGETGYIAIASAEAPATLFTLLEPLLPGPLGRFDHANEIIIKASEDTFQSVEPLLVFEGRNTIAIDTGDQRYELVQYLNAEPLGDRSFRLSGLLRGQLGTQVTHTIPAGQRGAVVDDDLVAIPIAANQVGRTLNYKIVPANSDIADPNALTLASTCKDLQAVPLAPVHLKARQVVDAIEISWIRRGWQDSDRWDQPEIPLEFAAEKYAVTIANAQGEILRETTSNAPAFSYSNADRIADLGGTAVPFVASVSQVSDTGLLGPAAEVAVNP